MAEEMHLYSAGDKLPESTGEMVQLSWGNFLDCTWEWLHWGYLVFHRGTILYFCRGILRLPGMLAEEYLYTLLENIKILWGYPTFSGLMVDQLCLGEIIADLLGILCLFRTDGRPTLLGGEYC